MGKLFELNANITRELDGFFGGRDLSNAPDMFNHFARTAAAPTTATQVDLGIHFGR